ncbi:GNAT family N-acetyltransferase [Aquibacillus koreensis]|uniref:GNAT family N-acetyltransferase n=1 Tax=Aquibacillus koreensis TaxID=279446 RepID=A0A9X4AI61_9BACI|nr:GNAT family N-acetyltransferase [Aquibacillus koreensis]MCT2538239.1 GNAT family N-acetyltransferase [Aquibacillus koreensis]MDC3420817.1 GNAT family N-acetyltransferase [Aquibacillus koreensis]
MGIVVTRELAEKFEKSEIDALRSRLTEMQRISWNPMDVEIQSFGSATAFSVKHIPGPSFNTVKGLKAGGESQIRKIIEFYKQKEIPVRFELTPAHTSPDLLTYLSERGFYQQDFHTTLYSEPPQLTAKNESGITIRRLQIEEFGVFADIYVQGFGMPSFLKDGVAQNNQILYDNKHWAFYLACYQNVPAGIGVLYIKDKIATLAAAATIPTLRKKGIQSALIAYRMDQALQQGCELIVGQAKFGSVSQNNMERAGFKIAYTKAIWVQK